VTCRTHHKGLTHIWNETYIYMWNETIVGGRYVWPCVTCRTRQKRRIHIWTETYIHIWNETWWKDIVGGRYARPWVTCRTRQKRLIHEWKKVHKYMWKETWWRDSSGLFSYIFRTHLKKKHQNINEKRPVDVKKDLYTGIYRYDKKHIYIYMKWDLIKRYCTRFIWQWKETRWC